jgi:hypothetical protein
MTLKSALKKNKELFYSVLLSVAVLAGLIIFKILNCSKEFFENDALHFNILSVNAILAGFLFTGLSIIISVIDKDRIKRLADNGYLDVFYNTIFTGIAFHVLSIVFSLINMLKILPVALIWFGYIEIGFLIIGLIIFVKSVLFLREIIQIIKHD